MERKKNPSLKLGECSGFFGIKLSILGVPRGHEGWTQWSLWQFSVVPNLKGAHAYELYEVNGL